MNFWLFQQARAGEADFLPLLVLTLRGAVPVRTILVIISLENAREFPEIITSTGAKFW